jgi:nucleotidyltransferase substrate binding protein (TIGR01987 family)
MEERLNQFKTALESFEYLVNIDLKAMEAVLDEKLIDGIENGMAQKFEICTELCWKCMRRFLKQEGFDPKTPKQAIKEFYLAGRLSEDDYLLLIKGISDRNELSHIYKEEVFRRILGDFPKYLIVFKNVFKELKTIAPPPEFQGS